MELTAVNVTTIFDECQDDEGNLVVESMHRELKFNEDRVKEHRDDILIMLKQLPEQFLESGGGGWSFLNSCMRQDGEQWTGFQMTQARLFFLGMAAGVTKETMADLGIPLISLPGGVPYYTVLDVSV